MSNPVQASIIAMVERDLAELERRDAAVALAPRSQRRKSGTSIVFSVRLTPAEVTALEQRAALWGLKPTVLARNLIRTGLAVRQGEELAGAMDRLEAAMSEVRATVL